MIKKELASTFDTVAPLYEKLRPGYVDELYQRIFNFAPINETSNVLEIGIGCGQATLPILNTGCRLTAIEYGTQFSELCKEKFKGYPKFSIITGKFEDIDLKEDVYDLVFSATAFHWIPEELGYPKVYSILKNGGVFAQFANHPYPYDGNSVLAKEMDKIYEMYYYPFWGEKKETLKEYNEEQARQKATAAEKYGFENNHCSLFYRTRTFSAKEYIMLLGTYSNHIAIEETIRTVFFSEIENAINRHGGRITVHDTIDLQLATKR